MKNRWNVDIRKGLKVAAHHPRGGTITGYVERVYNRTFTKPELVEYVHQDQDPHRRSAAKALPLLRKLGLIKLTTMRGRYYPTPKGWEWIERP